MKPNHDSHWRNNIKIKAQEIQTQLEQVFSTLHRASDPSYKPIFDEALAKLIQTCQAMNNWFGKDLIPKPLSQLTLNLDKWKTQLEHGQLAIRIAQLHPQLGKLDPVGDLEELSFTNLFQKHLQDDTLQQYLNELIAALTQVLEQGDDVLTSSAVKDLERILNELKQRKDQSLLDIQPWCEFAMTALAASLDTWTGTPFATICIAGLTAAKKSHDRVNQLFHLALEQYTQALEFRSQAKLKGEIRNWLINSTIDEATEIIADPAKLRLKLSGRLNPELPPTSSSPS